MDSAPPLARLPRMTATPIDPPEDTAANSAAAGQTPSAAGQTIALVDDDRNILASVSIGLQAEGFATRVYADGTSALKALLDNPPDLAVVDIKMPRMTGWSCCSACAKPAPCLSSSLPARMRSR